MNFVVENLYACTENNKFDESYISVLYNFCSILKLYIYTHICAHNNSQGKRPLTWELGLETVSKEIIWDRLEGGSRGWMWYKSISIKSVKTLQYFHKYRNYITIIHLISSDVLLLVKFKFLFILRYSLLHCINIYK